MCFTIDYRILHLEITPEATQDASHFYTLFYNAPPAIKVGPAFVYDIHTTDTVWKAFLHSMMGIGIVCLLGKLHRWDESAVWFDGSSLGMTKPAVRLVPTNEFLTAVFVFSIAVYLSVTIPALKAVVNPAEADPEFTFDQNLGLLGAGNTIIAGLLVLILVMQARHTSFVKRKLKLNILRVQGGQEYAKRAEARELAASEKGKTKAAKSE